MQKQDKIIQMFDQIAPTYDKANRILSFGIDVKWRIIGCDRVLKCFDKVKKLDTPLKELSKIDDKNSSPRLKIADVACGTGDMIMIWHTEAKKLNKKISSITGIDPSANMLHLAKEKITKNKLKNVNFIQAGAEKLPLDSDSIDILSISYGIRNVVQRKEALAEFARVLTKNGLLLVLEFTKPSKNGILQRINAFYMKWILPKIGGFISKNKNAYEYLPDSIDAFLTEEGFMDELNEAGFDMMYCENFSFGISSMFIAKKR